MGADLRLLCEFDGTGWNLITRGWITEAVLSNTYRQETLDSATNVTIDFDGASFRPLVLGHDVTFATANRPASGAGVVKSVVVRLEANGADRDFTWPSWKWLSVAPATLVNGDTAILSLTAFGPNESDVVAAYVVES